MNNTKLMRAVVRGTGSAVPEKILTNADLAKIVDTSDEWIAQRTGIRERRVSSEHETTFTLSLEASRKALEAAKVKPEELDMVILATVSGDFPWPATACLVQNALGAVNAGAFDLSAACAGFIYALSVGNAMLATGQAKKILVIGADCLTKQVDWTDRGTCILFGDAAAACVLEGVEDTDRGIIETILLSDGSGAKHIFIEAGGMRYPSYTPEAEGKRPTIGMSGSEVYRFAVNAMGDACVKVLEKAV